MKFCIEKMCSCIGDPSSRLPVYDPDRVFRCDFDVARVGGGRDYNKVKGLHAAFSKIWPSFCSKTHTGSQVHYSGYGAQRHDNITDL